MDELFRRICEQLEEKIANWVPIDKAVQELANETFNLSLHQSKDWWIEQIQYVADHPEIMGHDIHFWHNIRYGIKLRQQKGKG